MFLGNARAVMWHGSRAGSKWVRRKSAECNAWALARPDVPHRVAKNLGRRCKSKHAPDPRKPSRDVVHPDAPTWALQARASPELHLCADTLSAKPVGLRHVRGCAWSGERFVRAAMPDNRPFWRRLAIWGNSLRVLPHMTHNVRCARLPRCELLAEEKKQQWRGQTLRTIWPVGSAKDQRGVCSKAKDGAMRFRTR